MLYNSPKLAVSEGEGCNFIDSLFFAPFCDAGPAEIARRSEDLADRPRADSWTVTLRGDSEI
jgi:hypothetical protein